MKCVKYKYPLSIRQLSQKIESSVRLGESPFALTHRLFREDRLYGGIEDNKIWLMKTTPLKPRTQRVFRGEMYEEDGYTVIEGRFRFPLYDIIGYIVVLIFIWACSYTSAGFEALVWCTVVISLFSFLSLGINCLILRKEEKYVKAFLEKLERDYQRQ